MDGDVRGSPIIRTIITALCLIVAAWPLWRITHTESDRNPVAPTPIQEESDSQKRLPIPFAITLSAPATEIEIRDIAGQVLWRYAGQEMTTVEGELKYLPESMILQVTWTNLGAPRYFAKLTLEPPGQDELTNTFDAPGHMKELWELP